MQSFQLRNFYHRNQLFQIRQYQFRQSFHPTRRCSACRPKHAEFLANRKFLYIRCLYAIN